MRSGEISGPVADMARPQTFWKEQFERMVNKLIRRVAKQGAGLWIGQDDDATLVYDHYGVW